MIIGYGLPINEKVIKKAMFYFCFFLWGLTGMFLVYKDELEIGPFNIRGKIVRITGIIIIVFYWSNIVLAYI
jgi:hypothetical protein